MKMTKTKDCGADVAPSRKPKMAMGGYMKAGKKKPMGASNGGYMKKKSSDFLGCGYTGLHGY